MTQGEEKRIIILESHMGGILKNSDRIFKILIGNLSVFVVALFVLGGFAMKVNLHIDGAKSRYAKIDKNHEDIKDVTFQVTTNRGDISELKKVQGVLVERTRSLKEY